MCLCEDILVGNSKRCLFLGSDECQGNKNKNTTVHRGRTWSQAGCERRGPSVSKIMKKASDIQGCGTGWSQSMALTFAEFQ